MKVSVIVPVYNPGKWLRPCVESILTQTMSDFELILVDDGSTDGSEAACDEFALSDKRVKVIHQPNAGSNRARQRGVKESKGEFLTFVDADDELIVDALETMVRSMTEGCNIVIGFFSGERQPYAKVLDAHDYAVKMMEGEFSTCWGKLYRRELFRDSLFDMPREFVVGEDWLMGYRVSLLNRSKVKIIDKVVYKYNSVPTSLMHTHNRNPQASELLSYTLMRKAIPENMYDVFVPALLRNKFTFLRRIFVYKLKYHCDVWINSEFYMMLKADMKTYRVRPGVIEYLVFFKRIPAGLRRVLCYADRGSTKIKKLFQ